MASWPHPPNWRVVAIASALGLTSGGALAVDLPPAPDLPPLAAGAEGANDFSGWYLRGDLGAGLGTAPDLASAGSSAVAVPGAPVAPSAAISFGRATMSPSGALDGGVGYVFNSWARADATLEYRFGSRLSANYAIADPAPVAAGRLNAGVASLVALATGYVDLGEWWGVRPFVGAGVGVADNALSGVSDPGLARAGAAFVPVGGFVSNASRTNFAWALTAGLGVDIAPNLRLEVSYRYLNLGAFALGGAHCAGGGLCAPGASSRTLASNDVRVGLVYLIGDPAAPVARR